MARDEYPLPGDAKRRIPDEPAGRCPVCRMAFRGVRRCPRCGADLSRLMWLAVRSWQRRATPESVSEPLPGYPGGCQNAGQETPPEL